MSPSQPPFPRRIVGIDRPDPARDAIALAVALGGADGLVLARAYVFDPRAGDEFATYRDALAKRAMGDLDAVRDTAGLDAELVAVAETSPARALHALADERDADLLVVAASHRGPIGRAVLGDVARAVLYGAPCPVAVAPKGWVQSAAPPRTIGVAFDGRPESRAALEVAERAAEAFGAELRLLTALAPNEPLFVIPESAGGWAELAGDAERSARAMLDEVLAGLRAPASGEVVIEQPGRALAGLSESTDLLVCGSRGWGAAKRVVLGSTSDHLIHRAACPVLVVPRTAQESD